jgi:hypothetical protein
LADEGNDAAGPPAATALETAHYIEELSGELQAMAARHDLTLLAYLLSMAGAEAAALTRKPAEE